MSESGKALSEGYLKNHFLIAMPNLTAGVFKSSLTYICEHSEEGAMGIIVNRPSTMSIQDILQEITGGNEAAPSETKPQKTPQAGADQLAEPVMVGGPVALERGFVLHEASSTAERWDSSLEITSDIVLTGSRDILFALAEGRGPEKYLVALGYAGWSPGQLEQEMTENTWLTAPASSRILFATPYHLRAGEAAKQMGIDLASLSTVAGNA